MFLFFSFLFFYSYLTENRHINKFPPIIERKAKGKRVYFFVTSLHAYFKLNFLVSSARVPSVSVPKNITQTYRSLQKPTMGNFARFLDFTKNLVLQIILGFQKTLFVDPMIMIYTEFVIVFSFF